VLQRARRLIANERKTAYLIRTLWNAAGVARRKEPAFLLLLVRLGWTNVRKDVGKEATRRWRNRKIADYLGIEDVSDILLARALAGAVTSLNIRTANRLIKMQTGISNYYGAFRSPTDAFVLKNGEVLKSVFSQAAAMDTPPLKKVRSLLSAIYELGSIQGPRGSMSPLNGLTVRWPQARFWITLRVGDKSEAWPGSPRNISSLAKSTTTRVGTLRRLR
jgi:hypothetical protein